MLVNLNVCTSLNMVRVTKRKLRNVLSGLGGGLSKPMEAYGKIKFKKFLSNLKVNLWKFKSTLEGVNI